MQVTGLVLAAGGSRRLGRPKQLLPYRGGTLLDATLRTARDCGFGQLLVTLGGSAQDVRAHVDLAGTQVVDAPDFGAGCSASIRAALRHVDARSDGLVLLLGDQPAVAADAVRVLLGAVGDCALGVTAYDDGLGHPMWFARRTFPALAAMHGDKAVWKLLHAGEFDVREVRRAGPVPLDVDTWDDYQALLVVDA